MANKYTNYPSNNLSSAKGQLGNFQHASKTFVDNFYRLAPRYKFLFYAFFEIDNTIAQTSSLLKNRNDLEIPLLVKSTSLPSFNYDTVTKNRYNRKKIVYKQINYDPLSFVFHDDNAGITNALWYAYNEYFSNDMLHTNPYDWTPDNAAWSEKKYGMDTLTTNRFFKRITLYTMSRQKYNGYTLWGPRIKSWKHGDLDYSDGSGLLENSMTIEFEGVSYSSGNISEGSPDNFARIHYDYINSPLDTPAGGNSSQVFDSAPEPDFLRPSPDFSNNYFQAQAENRQIPLPTAPPPAANLNQISSPNIVGGVLGASFPIDLSRPSDTEAKPKSMNQNNQGSGFLAPTVTNI
jgi:hypothetical protein